MNTDESCAAKDESDGKSGDEEFDEEFDSEETRASMTLFSTIWMRGVTLYRQFS